MFCRQARAESLPARLVAMSASAPSSAADDTILVSQLFQTFTTVCAPCHTAAADPPGNGGFQIAIEGDFATKMTPAVLAHVTGSTCPKAPDPSDPLDPMPPCSSPLGGAYSSYAERPASDPIKGFAEQVQAWIQAGSPPTSFSPPRAGDAGTDAGTDAGAAGSFLLSPANGNEMTNIGNCVPSAALMAVLDDKGAELDAMFAGLQAKTSGTPVEMIGLPEHLGDTDLYTLDSDALARSGVIAYAPGYPLWSDDAGKLRYVRVPRGQSIHFDKATQEFEIPANTRFYKTFLKQIIDTDGSYRYRKIETRLIVARPDQNDADGTATPTALFGSYQWNDDESDAVLVQTPLNDGKPFADTQIFYHTDEPLAEDLLRGQPENPEVTLVQAHAARHYEIPSSDRCTECHMGSPSQSFVLGFTPLQVNRRAVGSGGTIEATGADELTQLQRFIDAGVITGIDSPSDVLPLEQSQGSRAPRNDSELVAQGYVLGNCSHCHNPRGFPTVENPDLKDVLNFLPSASGGIFQFPLERFSPRIGRGLTGTTPIPYITPSLVDLPRQDPQTGGQAADPFTAGTGPDSVLDVVYAPWRSIIFRNVDSAFAYTDDFALFPHMPMNTPGYDPRAKQILGDWMVSIPAARKHPELVEYAYQTDDSAADDIGTGAVDTSPQPYVEITPGSPGYDDAVSAATQRLQVFHSGVNPAVTLEPSGFTYSRYSDPGQTEDILDPEVLADPICHPIPAGSGRTSPSEPYPFAEHPHWVTTDLTPPPGPWSPRQPNWTSVLVQQVIPPESSTCGSEASDQAAYDDQVKAVGLLQTATLDEVRSFVTTPLPFGLWQEDPGCNFASVPTVQSFTGAQRPHWMDVANAAPSAPVYTETPGAAVFKMICINCHGPNADANGRLAQNLATMTGGNALVANFREGLFGPPGASSDASNRHAVFGQDALLAQVPDAVANWVGSSVTDDDRAARYMAWMGLGGTSVHIPIAVLEIVSITKVLDQLRSLEASQLSANMLSQAKALCLGLLGPTYGDATRGAYLDPRAGHGYLDALLTNLNHTLIPSNGDAELWLKLCSLSNPAPVHVLEPDTRVAMHLDVPTIENSQFQLSVADSAGGALIASEDYPPNQPVGNEQGGVDPSLAATNAWPWCVDDSGATSDQNAWIASNGLPRCPSSVQAASQACSTQQPGATCFGDEDANRWAVRGAINAGMSVYLYVQSIENSSPPPDYDQCGLLQ
jgi:mono/diheme cytochrome c family protein